MIRAVWVLAVVAFCGASESVAQAQLSSPGLPKETKPTPYSVAAVVGQFIGRFNMSPDGTGEVIGYFPLIEGIGTNLFAPGDPAARPANEKSALFSVRSDRMAMAAIPNGSLNHFLLTAAAGGPIQYRVYYNAAPSRNYNSPATFSDGTLIATFTASNGMVTITPAESHYQANLTLNSSQEFAFGAKFIDFANFGAAVAVQMDGALVPASLANGASIPLSGFLTAVAQ